MVMRDFWLTWILSVMFEIMEYSLEHQLPNFAECFGMDTRLLTDHGFLTRDQLREYLAKGEMVLFACYDTKSGTLVYRRGKLVDVPNREKKLLSFTSTPEALRWSADSNSYGENEAAATEKKKKKQQQRKTTDNRELLSNHLSLRVTGNHDMYVQRGNSSKPPSKVKASELQPSSLCDCPEDDCQHRRASLRFFASAVGGVAVEASSATLFSAAMEKLGLVDATQIEAFLELYGFWLGNGSMGLDCLRFIQPASEDATWLRDQLKACGLADKELNISKAADGEVAVCVLRPSWFAAFDSEYGSSTSSTKSFFMWVLRGLNKGQSQLLLTGLHRADDSWSTGKTKIVTSSSKFREEVMVLAMHAGFSAYFFLTSAQGGSNKKHRGGVTKDCSAKEVTASNKDSWTVCWGEEVVHRPNIKCQDIVEEPYDGELWCVTVDHADHLIVAQRAELGPDGTATKASSPVIVGQCWWDHVRLNIPSASFSCLFVI